MTIFQPDFTKQFCQGAAVILDPYGNNLPRQEQYQKDRLLRKPGKVMIYSNQQHVDRYSAYSTRGLRVVYLLGLLIFCWTSSAQADETQYQSQDELQQNAKAFLESRVKSASLGSNADISFGRLDSRLRLAKCQTNPEAFLPSGAKLQGKLSVGLRCNDPKPWTVYIPANIRTYTNVLAAAHSLARGEQLSPSDIISVRQEMTGLHLGYFTDKKDIVGKILTRSINAGQVFVPKRLKAPLLVHRGDKVTIIAATEGILVRGKGEALEDAAKGERISVRNTRSKRVIQAVATELGTVKVTM